MSFSNSVSSFSPTAFFKDWYVPAMVLTTGVAIGSTLAVIGLLGRINDINMCNSDVQKGIAKRVKIVFAAWCAAAALTDIELVFRHSGFGILGVASAAVSTAVILSIKWEIQKQSSSIQGDTQAKLASVAGYLFLSAILNTAGLAFILLDSTGLE